MLKISALNEELSEESSGVDEPIVPTKEVEEAESLNLYKEALELRQKNEFEAALKLFHQTLALPCIEMAVCDEKEDKNNPDIATMSSCLQLKYACLKNIGALYVSKGNCLNEALEAYLEAVEVDPHDVTVWYNIGKISINLKNFQLARHAFLQGLTCSPNHWPCLDGMISVLFGLGDDIGCLHYINIALGRDPFYIRGLILRDSIFQDSPSLKEDIKEVANDKWIHLFENCHYSETEKNECLKEANDIRAEVGGQYTEVVLPNFPLAKKIESLSWIAVGESLLATYKSMLEDTSSLKMSFTVELEFPQKNNEVIPTVASPIVIEPMECIDGQDAKAEQFDGLDTQVTQRVDDPSDLKQRSRKNSTTSDETGKPDAETFSDPTTKMEPPTKSESRKRKRSLENEIAVSDKEIQRRSTRSRAYAQQAEEDIYSLRAELRSFLPTSLLLDENFQTSKDAKIEEEVKLGNIDTSCLGEIPMEEEERGVSMFLQESQLTKMRIIDLLGKFCIHVTTLDGFRWTRKLCEIFKEAYQSVRGLLHVCDLFESESKIRECNGLETLIHAEILISSQKLDSTESIPSWFTEDLTYLFQLADPIDSFSTHSNTFQARVFWLHSNWHFQNGRVDVASNYLQMVNNCFKSLSHENSVVTRAIDKPIVLKVSDVSDMDKVLVRTMQLEDIVKLHQEKKFKHLVSILKTTFAISDSKTSNHKYRVPVDRPTQINMLLEGLSALEDFDEFLIWSEQSLDESTNQYLAAYNRKNSEEGIISDDSLTSPTILDWSKVVERISMEIEETLHFRRTSLGVLNRRALVRFAENLVLICSHQLEAPDTISKMPLCSPIFWVLLHRVIEFEESRLTSAKKNELESRNSNATAEDETEEEFDESLPCSVLFLISAHDLLGKHSWCMLQNGVFVLHLLEVLMRRRRITQDHEDREELGRAIEQASFCALGYPTSKKSKGRSLTDHAVPSVSLTWKRVLLLAEFFLPTREDLPEFDTVKPTSNAEQEMLLQKVSSLIPPELDPRNRLEDIQSFIQGRRSDIPEYLNHSCVPREVENVYYLLGDYYFKNKEWTKAIDNYFLDLALVPDRFDSWAAVALAIGSRLETKLNSCERLKNLGTFLDRAETALRCFRRALCLRPLQTTLWIEQGSTAYMLHSFCSQLLRNETDSLSIEMFERLEKEKDRMLDITQDCFVAADKASLTAMEKGTGDDQDERWLHHYMLGKVAEKRSKPFSELIEHYQRAAKLLEESSAAYPRKIPYNTPPHLSVEALEIHYRIHSQCLKTLMSFEGRPRDSSAYLAVSKQLELASNGAFAHGGRRVSIEHKDDVPEKETKKRKASKHEDEKPTKKGNTEPSTLPSNLILQSSEVKLEGRAATIHDVAVILNEILEQVVQVAKPIHTPMCEDVVMEPLEEKETSSLPIVSDTDQQKEKEIEPTQPMAELPVHSSTSTSSSSDSSSSDSESSSSDSDVKKAAEQKESSVVTQEIELPDASPVPDLQPMVDICVAAIKECVGRFPHFYKGLYRLAHYYYHSKVNHNIEACRELLLGRPQSASMVQLQQQQGLVQVRFLPTAVAGLFTEWRSNNFFHGIWRIPINEIDRPGCFASHMGRSAALLLDVLRETRDHRLLMELALALQPEPEPDKKYLFDSEREQHAGLALSLMLQVLRSRLQDIKDASNIPFGPDDLQHSSPQHGSPSSSKKLSLLMDTFRAYDRIERNLPGQEAVFGALLIDSFKVYRGPKDQNESDASLMEQALVFCRNKQAQSRARVGGVRGGHASSLGVVATRGKRAYTTNRRGRAPAVGRAAAVRDHLIPGSLPAQASSNLPPGQNSANVMQEAMKLLQSAGGSINNLPQHLKNIPGISNLLALFSNPAGDKSATDAPVLPPIASPRSKKDIVSSKPATSAVPPVAHSAPSTSLPQTSSMSNSLMQSLAAVGGTSPTPQSLASVGMMDPAFLSMLSNPYFNPMSMFGASMGGPSSADASSMSKMQQEYQQQLSNWMQSALAQSYMFPNMNSPFFAPSTSQRSRGRGIRKSSSNRPRANTAPKESFKTTPNAIGETSNAVASTNSTRTPTPDASSRNKQPLDFLKRSDSTESSSKPGSKDIRAGSASKLPSDFKLPPPLFDPSMMRLPTHHDSAVKNKPLPSSVPSKKKHLPSTSSSSVGASSGKPHKRAISTPTIDVSKLIAGFSPAFELGRMGQQDTKAVDSSARGKLPKVNIDPHLTPYSSKPSSGKSGSKEMSAPFPIINLGRDITVTATSTSSKPIVPQPTFPTTSSSGSRGKQSQSQHFPSTSLNPPVFPGIPATSQLFPIPASSGRSHDPHNIAFSVLQNLPSSMSLLIKPQNLSQPKQSAKTQAGPMDLVVPKAHQHSANQLTSLPKLTPAPKPQGSKKVMKHTGVHHQVPPLSLPSSSSASPIPPFLSITPTSSAQSSQLAASRNLSNQKFSGKGKGREKDSSDDFDVVVLD